MTAMLSTDILEDKQRVTELFRRLNFECMKLSTYDLVAMQFRSFDYKGVSMTLMLRMQNLQPIIVNA